MTERFDLLTAEDPRDLVHRAVACLAQGGVVALPTETSYILAASALNDQAVQNLRAIEGGSEDNFLSLVIRDSGALIDWVPSASIVGQKLARRAWPGPLTLVFSCQTDLGLARRLPDSVQKAMAGASGLALRVPEHDVVREILDLIPGPLVASSVPVKDQALVGQTLMSLAGLSMILDDGPTSLGGTNTMVSVQDDRWSIVREGVVDSKSLLRMTGTMLLFVCTGNTCRSPMAEAICRILLADRLDCDLGEIEVKGFSVGSAGLAAGQGMRAAGDAVAIVQTLGGSLRNHSSRQIEPRMVSQADWIITMTRDHSDALLDEFPEAKDRVILLNPSGGDIADPIGMDRETYRRTAEAIKNHLKPLINQIVENRDERF